MTETHFAVDAGGSWTRAVAASDHSTYEDILPSVNPASVGSDAATATLRMLLSRLKEAFPACTEWAGWIASAAVSHSTLAGETERLRCLRTELPGRVQLTLTGDITPLLLAPPMSGAGVVVAAGTGSCCVAVAQNRPAVLVGGHEYLLSDEGGGFDIGLRGLRAATRAFDGRGQPTALLSCLERRYALDVPAIGRLLADTPRPKTCVAEFAADVIETWQHGDAEATVIIADSVEELVHSALVAVERCDLNRHAPVHVCVTGGLFARRGPFLSLFEHRLALVLPNATISVAETSSEAALLCVRAGLSPGPLAPLPWARIDG